MSSLCPQPGDAPRGTQLCLVQDTNIEKVRSLSVCLDDEIGVAFSVWPLDAENGVDFS